jgi:hypothetical protein
MSKSDHKVDFQPEAFAQAAKKAAKAKKLPPVHLWNPDFCGDIDMQIKRDGSWHYMGTPIHRKRMVRLFSTVLRYDVDEAGQGKYYLVTPVEKVGIIVDDAPFIAAEMSILGEGDAQEIHFITNLGDEVTADKIHPITVDINEITREPSPYVLVRGGLKALLSRSNYYELAMRAFEKDGAYYVKSGGESFFFGEMEE